MTSPAALHSSGTAEHYTPPEIVEAARLTMGAIDLDPFSCAAANAIVKAREYISLEIGVDGFGHSWCNEKGGAARVFVNPPGGKYLIDAEGRAVEMPRDESGRQNGPGTSGVALAWWTLLDEYEAGRVEQAIFVCFSLNVFQTAQKHGAPPPCAFPFCVPSKRLRYISSNGKTGKSPPHPSAIVYVPPKHLAKWASRFGENFSPFGYVRT